MDFDASRLRRGEVIAGASGALLLVSMFFPWYGYKINARSLGSLVPSEDAWNAFTVVSIYLLLTAAIALSLALVQATRRSPALPVSLSVIALVLGLVATVVILLRILDPPAASGLPSGFGSLAPELQPTLKLGAWVGLVSAIGITAGSYLSMREEGIRESDGPGEIETVTLMGSGRA